MEVEGSDVQIDDNGDDQDVEEEHTSGVFIPGKTQHDGGELEFDPAAYMFLHQLQAGWCH